MPKLGIFKRNGLHLAPLRLGVRELDDFMCHSFRVMHDELHTVKVRISSNGRDGPEKRSGTRARKPTSSEMAVLILPSGSPAWLRLSAGS